MLSKSSTHSTSGQEDYLGGLLLERYETLSDPLRYSKFPEFAQPLHTNFYATVSSPNQRRSWLMEGNDDIALRKVIGCLMILMMPEEGLNETLISLKDMLEFYMEVPELSLPPEHPTHRVVGNVVSPMRRPDLVISE